MRARSGEALLTHTDARLRARLLGVTAIVLLVQLAALAWADAREDGIEWGSVVCALVTVALLAIMARGEAVLERRAGRRLLAGGAVAGLLIQQIAIGDLPGASLAFWPVTLILLSLLLSFREFVPMCVLVGAWTAGLVLHANLSGWDAVVLASTIGTALLLGCSMWSLQTVQVRTAQRAADWDRVRALLARVSGSLEPKEIAPLAVQGFVELAAADFGALLLPGIDGFEVAAAHGALGDLTALEGLPVETATLGNPLEPRTFGGLWAIPQSDDDRLLRALSGEGTHTVVSVPLRQGDRLVGSLLAGYRQRHRFRGGEAHQMAAASQVVTNALMNAEAFAAQRSTLARLEQLHKLKTEFVDNVSHEFRTPLTVIRGCSQTLAERWDGLSEAERQELNEMVRRGATQLTTLIETLLQHAAVQSGITGFQPQRQDLRDLVGACVHQAQPALRQRIVLTQSRVAVPVSVDGPKVDVVLRNLLDNAGKFAPAESDIVVDVSGGGAWAELAVGDRGPGVPASMRERIFDRFVKLDDTPRGGTGIGLALSRELVVLHGGEIFVDPLYEGGARFVVRLPLAQRQAVPEMVLRPRAAKPVEAAARVVRSAAATAGRRQARPN